MIDEDFDEDEDDPQDPYCDPDFAWRDSSNLVGCQLGLELEAVAGDNGYDIVRAMPPHRTAEDGPAPMFERDGSLPFGGVEIIFPPYPADLFFNNASYISRAIQRLNRVQSWEDHNICGLHFNVNTTDMTPLAQRVFCAVFYSMPVRVMEHIGGRALTGYCNQRAVGLNERVCEYRPAQRCHRYCVEQSTHRIECRFPGGTRNMEQIQKLVTLFTAAREYSVQARPLAAMLVLDVYQDFLLYLANSEEETYAHLLEILRAVA